LAWASLLGVSLVGLLGLLGIARLRLLLVTGLWHTGLLRVTRLRLLRVTRLRLLWVTRLLHTHTGLLRVTRLLALSHLVELVRHLLTLRKSSRNKLIGLLLQLCAVLIEGHVPVVTFDERRLNLVDDGNRLIQLLEEHLLHGVLLALPAQEVKLLALAHDLLDAVLALLVERDVFLKVRLV